MTRSAGTITGGTGQSLLAAAHTALVAHAAWEHVETIADAPSTGDDIRVYRCLGTLNSVGQDFYLALMWDATYPTRLYGTVFEGYDAGTDMVTNYPPFLTSNPEVGASGQVVGTAYPNPVIVTSAYIWPDFHVETSTGTYDYNVSVTNDRVIITSSLYWGNAAIYLGAYEDFVQIPNNFPICALSLTGSGDSASTSSRFTQGGATRHPGREGQPFNLRHFALTAGCAPNAAWINNTGFAVGNSDPDLFLGGGLASRIVCRASSATTTAMVRDYGGVRGLLFDVLRLLTETAVIIGDTFTFGTDVYDVASKPSAAGAVTILLKQGV